MALRDFIKMFCCEIDDVIIQKYNPIPMTMNELFRGLCSDVSHNSIFDRYKVLRVEAIKNNIVLTVTE